MRRNLLVAATIAISFGFASPAAAAVCIAVDVGAGLQNETCSAPSGKASYNTSFSGFSFDVSGTGFPLLSQPLLTTNTLDIRNEGTANRTIDVYVTQTGLSGSSIDLLSTFTSNTMSGVTAIVRSYYDTTNTKFGLANLLQSANFAGPGVFNGDNLLTTSGLWSETVRYTLNFTGGQGSYFNGTADLSAVPEPATWAMMLIGFTGIGMTMRRKTDVRRLAQIA